MIATLLFAEHRHDPENYTGNPEENVNAQNAYEERRV
jgi:hypothetical protein